MKLWVFRDSKNSLKPSLGFSSGLVCFLVFFSLKDMIHIFKITTYHSKRSHWSPACFEFTGARYTMAFTLHFHVSFQKLERKKQLKLTVFLLGNCSAYFSFPPEIFFPARTAAHKNVAAFRSLMTSFEFFTSSCTS